MSNNLPDGWEKKTLGTVCVIKPSKIEVRQKLKPHEMVSFVPMRDLKINIKELISVQTRKLKEVIGSYTYFENNDVLLAKITPCFENGKVGIARNLINGIGFGSSEFIVFRSNGEVISEYLYYYLSQQSFRDEGKRRMSGAVGHKRVSKDFIKNYKLPYPLSLPEQKRIVKILDKVFENIDKAKINTEKNLQNSKDLFDSYLQSVFSKYSTDWVEKSFGDKELLQIIDGDRGKNYPRKKDFFPEGYCLFMNTKNVRPDGFNFKTKMFITEKKDSELGKGKLTRNDVVMTTRGTIGNIGLYSNEIPIENIRINSGMLIFRSNPKVILPEYLFEVLRSGIMKSQIKENVSGAAQPQLPIKTLVNFKIPVPKKISKQKEIVENIQELYIETEKLKSVYQQKMQDLEELKKSILQKAFKGKL